MIINTDATPLIPEGLEKIARHIAGGPWEFDPKKTELLCFERDHTSIKRLVYGVSRGLSACVLDQLLSVPQLIPDEFDGVALPGTLYLDEHGTPYYRAFKKSLDTWGSAEVPLQVANDDAADKWIRVLVRKQ